MIRVLLVDDHQLFRSGVRARLREEDGISTVGEAGTAGRAVIVARALQPDVVLLDLVLPRKSGSETIPELLKAAPSMKVIVVSSQSRPSSVRQAIAAGARGYVLKRASEAELIDAIRRVATGERYVDPDLGAQLAGADSVPELEPLSNRELDVIQLLALGYTNAEIGAKLYLSVRTVDTHRAHIMRKLRLGTRAELVLFALANGLIGSA
ncbi:DNA-binding NarL/FixJ family response regulator [Kribbella steppae]|uniref:DNA-binding NarL/FixJ family response regulator n=1 Tax=Kribbella steppae TaxID=2512223 RepID=A0A4R2H3K4_9ACTN|nr:response regulator transcription factor [Kribbella steppae]TCO19734.1 DNA-binding NarL/FixJ family response regulator [Kribbella steppae]